MKKLIFVLVFVFSMVSVSNITAITYPLNDLDVSTPVVEVYVTDELGNRISGVSINVVSINTVEAVKITTDSNGYASTTFDLLDEGDKISLFINKEGYVAQKNVVGYVVNGGLHVDIVLQTVSNNAPSDISNASPNIVISWIDNNLLLVGSILFAIIVIVIVKKK